MCVTVMVVVVKVVGLTADKVRSVGALVLVKAVVMVVVVVFVILIVVVVVWS
jgi:hypothetical protein